MFIRVRVRGACPQSSQLRPQLLPEPSFEPRGLDVPRVGPDDGLCLLERPLKVFAPPERPCEPEARLVIAGVFGQNLPVHVRGLLTDALPRVYPCKAYPGLRVAGIFTENYHVRDF